MPNGCSRLAMTRRPAVAFAVSAELLGSNQKSEICNLQSYIRHPFQKQGRPVPKQRSGTSRTAEIISATRDPLSPDMNNGATLTATLFLSTNKNTDCDITRAMQCAVHISAR
jgi:hypothetical protein